MPVDATHSQYTARAPQWKRCRDAIAGQDTVHAAGVEYLPKLVEQTTAEYDSYRKRAGFFNASQRTTEGLVGMVFRKPPVVEAKGAESMLDDITMAGVPFAAFAETAVEEVVKVGRYGILVDFPRVDNAPRTVAEAEAAGNRPFMIAYKAESILDWKSERIANRMTLTQVRLMEEAEVVKDEFTTECVPQIRVLDLVAGVYRVRLFRKAKQGDREQWVQHGEDIFPLKGGASLTEIPFVFAGVRDLTPDCSKPPLLDLVDVNLAHYRVSADYEHGCHFTGLPTAWIAGYSPAQDAQGNTERLYIGSTSAWVFPDTQAKAGFLEFTGQGLGALEKNLSSKEEKMAALGARMLSPEKKQAETAETASIHRAGEASVLSSLAISVSRALTKSLQTMLAWAGISGTAKVELNTDYYPIPMTPEQLNALVATWQSGGISKETLFWNLQQGEVVREGQTFEDEEAAIANNPPLAMQAQQSLLDNPPPPEPGVVNA